MTTEDKRLFSFPPQTDAEFYLKNETTGKRTQALATKPGQTLSVFQVVPDTRPPIVGGRYGEYGDDWPTIPTYANHVNLRAGGNNRIDFGDATVIRDETFDGEGKNYALKLNDCKGSVYFVNCTFRNAIQALAVSNPSKEFHTPNVYIIECNFEDIYVLQEKTDKQPMAQVAVYYNDPMPRDDDQPTLGLYGNNFINIGIKGNDSETRDRYARMYHHPVYCKGNAIIEVYDNLFINYSGQGIKAIGYEATVRRNVFICGAVGWNFGQDEEQQSDDKTGRWQMDCVAVGNLVYGMGDINADNQRLGWGCVLESCNAYMRGNIFASPRSDGRVVPAIRCINVEDYPVSVITRPNNIVTANYTHVVEVEGKGREWAAGFSGYEDGVILDNSVGVFASRTGGQLDESRWDYTHADVGTITLDVPRIEALARQKQITAADILEDARGQLA